MNLLDGGTEQVETSIRIGSGAVERAFVRAARGIAQTCVSNVDWENNTKKLVCGVM